MKVSLSEQSSNHTSPNQSVIQEESEESLRKFEVQMKFKNWLQCPKCREKIIKITSFFSMNSINYISYICQCSSEEQLVSIASYLDFISAQKDASHKKENCHNQNHKESVLGEIYCAYCDKWFCKSCLVHHREICSNHSRYEILYKLDIIHFCPNHKNLKKKKKVKGLCKKCHEELCLKCFKSPCKSDKGCHDIVVYQDEYEKTRKELDQIRDIKNLEDFTNLQKAHYGEIKKKFTKQISKAREELKNLKKYFEYEYENQIRETEKLKKMVKMIYENFDLCDILPQYNCINSMKVINFNLRIKPLKFDFEGFSQLIKKTQKEIVTYFGKNLILQIPKKISTNKWISCVNEINHNLIAGVGDNTVRIYDYGKGNLNHKINLEEDENAYSILANNKTNDFFIGTNHKRIYKFSLEVDRKEMQEIILPRGTIENAHDDDIYSIIRLRNGWYATCSADKYIKFWDETFTNSISSFKGHNEIINSLIELDPFDVVVSCAGDGMIKLWDEETRKNIVSVSAHNNIIYNVIQINSKKIGSASEDGTIKIWDISSLGNKAKNKEVNCIHVITNFNNFPFSGICLLYNGNIVSCSDDKTIKVYEPNCYKCIEQVCAHDNNIIGIFQVDNQSIASFSDDNTIKVWNL